jgi:RNase P protein component
MGLTVSAKYGDSVERNLFKRRNREIYRRLRETIPSGWMIHIRPLGKVKQVKEVASYEALRDDWAKLVTQIQLWTEAQAASLQSVQTPSQPVKGTQDSGHSSATPGTQ